MSRYIEIDTALLKTVTAGRMSAKALWRRIMQQPTIDIVRCKECKHNYNKALNHGKMYPRCDFTDWKLSENDYCSRGEREGE